MAVSDRKDPYAGFNFVVEIEGLVVGGFSEVSGLQVEIEVQPFREGGWNGHLHQITGPAKYPSNLVLKRGLGDSDVLWNWQRDVARGHIKRRNGSLILRDAAGREKWRWNFYKAYPVKWQGPDLHAATAETAVEVLELVHEGLVKS